jgi:hypothetical protein
MFQENQNKNLILKIKFTNIMKIIFIFIVFSFFLTYVSVEGGLIDCIDICKGKYFSVITLK